MRLCKDRYINKYNEIYESVIRKLYKCTNILNENLIKISKDEFVKLCLSDMKSLVTINDITEYLYFNEKYQYTFSLKPANFLFELFCDGDDSLKKINEFLIKKFTINGKINYELLLANLIYIIDKNDANNQITFIFCKLSVLKNYKDCLLLLNILQQDKYLIIKDKEYSYYYSGFSILSKFCKTFKEFFKIVGNKRDKILDIMGDNYFKHFFFFHFDIYINDKVFGEEGNLIFLLTHLDTYKWLDEERKNQLDILSENHIFYAEHAIYLSNLGKNEYLNKMTEESMKDECIIV